ncbi:MAG TPA: hypothetical protein VKZ49_11470 [Polyangiaceae bacterium]|nr:hypothetical protein [Polyangiaceae bacterium]
MALRHKGWFRSFDAALAALMVSASAVSGHAEPPPAARSRVAFSAAPGCPGWAEFAAEVAQRTNASIVPSAFGRGDYAVWLFPTAGGYAGRLYSERHERVVKDVAGDRCEETATALALVLALSIEHGLDDRRGAVEPARPEPPDRAADPGPVWGGGVGVAARNGLAPEALSGVAGYAEVASLASGWWWWAVRGTLSRGSTGSVRYDWGSARFTLDAATIDLCPLRVHAWDGGEVDVCSGMSLGRLRATGEVTEPGGRSGSTSRSYWEARLLARPRAVLWSVLVIEGELGLNFPFSKYEFLLESPQNTLHTSSALQFGAGIGLGFRIP